MPTPRTITTFKARQLNFKVMPPLQPHDMPCAVQRKFMTSNCMLSPCHDGLTLWVHTKILPMRPNPIFDINKNPVSTQLGSNDLQSPMFCHAHALQNIFLRKLTTLLQVFCLCIMLSQRFHVSCPVTTLLWLRTLPSSWLKLPNTTSDKPALI